MTTLAEALDVAIKVARRVKEHAARRRESDVHSALMLYRGNELIAHVFPEQGVNRDAMLGCARAAVSGFDADLIAVVFETFKANATINPLTGKEWRPGEMQKAVEQHDARGQGWITDALLVTVYNRAEDCRARILPYRIVSKRVVWQPVPDFDGDALGGGYVHKQLLAAMARPSLGSFMAATGITADQFGLDTESARAHQDCAVAKVFAGTMPAPAGVPRASVALAAESGTIRERIIRQSLPGGKVIKP